MKSPAINFKCPKCGHNRLVMQRHGIKSREVIEGFTVVDSSSPGRKYNLQTSSTYHDEGSLDNFKCECCNFVIERETKSQVGVPVKKNQPIKSLNHLHGWLKKNGMLQE